MIRKYILFVVLLFSAHSTDIEHYGWCSPYDTFCLFSEGNEVRVSSLSEAQLKCNGIKNDSWPVELGDERVKEVFIEFINNHSISNVILNALNRNGTWYWKKNNTSVQTFYNVRDTFMLYNDSGFYSNYSVVCLTDCRAKWTDINETRMFEESYHHLSVTTIEKCQEFCERNITCSSIDWTFSSAFHGCWIHKYPYDVSKLTELNETTHHKIDRSEKTVQICIATSFDNFKESDQKDIRNDSKKLVQILVPIILIVSLLIVIIILIVFFYKRRKEKSDSPEDFGTFKPSQNMGNGNSYSQQNENNASTTELHAYYNVEKVPKEPKRCGPMGQQYTEVDKNNKLSTQ